MPALQPAPLEHNIPDGKCLFRDLYLLLSSHLIATSLLQRDVLPRVHLSRLGKQTQFRKCLSNQTLRRIFFACAYLFIQH